MQEKPNQRVLLIGLHNEKALGVRYLANAAEAAGYEAHILFFKGFNSETPEPATENELRLLREEAARINPMLVGVSVMSSLYLETARKVTAALRQAVSAPIAWGGVWATLASDRAVRECDFVMRGEGEVTICEVLDCLAQGRSVRGLSNLAFAEGEQVVCNPLRPLEQDLDRYGYPRIGDRNMALIAHDSLRRGDPQLRSIIYELSASRGCPFSCTYCSSVNLRRCYQGLGRYVRFRSVDSVMNELLAAKKAMPGLRVIHFWDEIFSDEPGWVEQFCQRYKREIGLPFRIWGHPLKVNAALISTMVDAGLYQVVMGIQSGSYRVRHEIFHRPESNEQVEQAAAVLADCRVPHVVYDFMLLHPFEREDDLRETFRMCLRLKPPFSLNIHGLNFLPETDIVQMAMDERIYTREQLDRMMYTGLQEQYDRYWGAHASDYGQASTDNIWISLIYLTQFPQLHGRLMAYWDKTAAEINGAPVFALEWRMKRRARRRELLRKVRLALRGK